MSKLFVINVEKYNNGMLVFLLQRLGGVAVMSRLLRPVNGGKQASLRLFSLYFDFLIITGSF